MRCVQISCLMAIVSSLPAQQQRWQLSGGLAGYETADPFDDLNNDGVRDVLLGVVLNPSAPNASGVLRVASGIDGSTIFQRSSSALVKAVGDFNGDGRSDYIARGGGNGTFSRSIEVRDFPTGQILWRAYGPGEYFFGDRVGDTSLTADLDLTGDGRPDVLTMTSHVLHSVVYAYSNTGVLLYQLPLHPYRWVGNNVTAMPDLDGDGCQDFLVGCIEPSGRGAVAVVSGLTGALLRLSYGVLPGDYIGGTVCNAGDMDQDGYPEYAAASYWSSPLLSIVVFSGRTGAVLHNWTDFPVDHNGMQGNVDVDLDGVPDLVAGYDEIRAYSGRDGSVLWRLRGAGWAWPVFVMGVQPGSPYPDIGFLDNNFYQGPASTPSYRRIVMLWSNLAGAGPVTGAPCSSNADLPLIGMRSTPGHLRMTVSNGPPGALALLAGGPAAQTTFGNLTLPYSLDPIGFVGCSAHVPAVVVVPTTLGTVGMDAGYAGIDLPWPVLWYAGHAFAAQWLLLDPTNGAYALTARHGFAVP